jgi:hypothetical protein
LAKDLKVQKGSKVRQNRIIFALKFGRHAASDSFKDA